MNVHMCIFAVTFTQAAFDSLRNFMCVTHLHRTVNPDVDLDGVIVPYTPCTQIMRIIYARNGFNHAQNIGFYTLRQ